MIVDVNATPKVLLVERMRRRGDPWSGDLACPGGFADTTDRDAVFTAMREAREEVGVELERDARWLGRLPSRRALHLRWPPAFVIEPHVFVVRAHVPDVHPRSEVTRAFWCALSDVTNLPRTHVERRALGITLRFEAVPLDPVPLWGITLHIVDDLVRVMCM